MQVVAGAASSIWATSRERIFVFVVCTERLLLLLCCLLLVLACFRFLDLCFGSFRVYCFFYANQWVKQICTCSFSFRLAPLFVFFCPSLSIPIHIAPHASFFPPRCSKWSSLTTISIPADFLLFSVVCMYCKICLPHPFVALFSLCLLSPVTKHSIAPMQTDLHPSAPILDAFRLNPQNMMSGEISPGIGP